jgi:hypothetical protein
MALASTSPAPTTGTASAPMRPSRVTFDAPPGKMQLRLSVEGAGSQVLDTEVREITVPDLTSAQTVLGTPAVFRARTVRDLQQLKSDPDAVPVPARDFSRTDRMLIRVPAYGPGGTSPRLSVHLLNRAGNAMTELTATPAPSPTEQSIDVPLTGLAPGEYVVEIKADGDGGGAQELVGFRVTG